MQRKKEQALLKNYNKKLEYYSPAGTDDLGRIMLTVEAPVVGEMLDVGCGDGRASLYAEKHGMPYVGIDYSQSRITKAKETHGQRPDDKCRPCFVCADLYDMLPSINPGFELVFCCETLEHLEYPSVIWDELKRLSTQMVVCTVPVNMPHVNHLQIFKKEKDLHNFFSEITEVRRMRFRTPGGKLREHFVFTHVK